MKTYIEIEDIVPIHGIHYEEQETCITYMHNDKVALISTNDNSFINKIKKRMQKSPNSYKCFIRCDKANIDNYFFEVPKKLISFRTERPKKELTEEQRMAFSERAKQMLKRRYKNEL